ncbi:MAG: hypothetical protein II117_05700 [Clostridia bacterium]|nr:hypothetical protein [Clostridia bacterium]
MKVFRLILCIGVICFLLFTPQWLARGAQESFVDARFVRKVRPFQGTIVIYHVVRQRPYAGSMTQWLKNRAEEYEKKHKGVYIEIEGMDEAAFFERIENGRTADAYSFFSGTLYRDRIADIPDLKFAYREGLFQTDKAVPYCYTGYCRLVKKPDGSGEKKYYANDILAAMQHDGKDDAPEEKADILYLDLRRAGDLIRNKEAFSLAAIEPVDHFTDAVCWMSIDRETDEKRSEVLLDFMAYLLSEDAQRSLNALGLLSVLDCVKNVPPESALKNVFKTYETVQTVDPFLWQGVYDELLSDAALSRKGDTDAHIRFTNRLHELYR